VTVSPTTNTTYFVRAEGDCNTTPCASLPIVVKSLSTTPTGISATANPICAGQSTTLTPQGGSLGTGASWKWYSASCGGTYIGTGTSITVNPTTTTIYFVRAEGDCNTTNCASLTVTVNTPVLITDHPDSGSVCTGQSWPFCVTATGTPPLTYQWRKDGSSISNATSSCYTATQAGTYDCVVSNPCGPVPSNSATLTIVATRRWYQDLDGDTYGNGAVYLDQCEPPDHYVDNDDDCDDTCASCHPGGTEACDGKDNDCNGIADDEGAQGCTPYYLDHDGDGYGPGSETRCLCAPQGEWRATQSGDCDDNNAAIHPDATDICGDGVDQDCDGGDPNCPVDPSGACCVGSACQPNKTAAECTAAGGTYKGDGSTCGTPTCPTLWRDADGDGYGDPNTPGQGVNYVTNDDDCDDSDPNTHPGATDECGKDRNCDGQFPTPKTWYYDGDHDGYGIATKTKTACTQPTDYVEKAGDSDDADEHTYPGAPEICDDKDNDGDGQIDEGECLSAWYRDADGDGWGTREDIVWAASQPSGYVPLDKIGDCDDSDPTITASRTWYRDADGDGYGNPQVTVQACTQPAGYVGNDGDCDDADSGVGPAKVWYEDGDGDGYGNYINTLKACRQPVGYVADSSDCNDEDASINPAAVEILGDEIDQNCDGSLGSGIDVPRICGDGLCGAGAVPAVPLTLLGLASMKVRRRWPRKER
jgi:hypothetical protein